MHTYQTPAYNNDGGLMLRGGMTLTLCCKTRAHRGPDAERGHDFDRGQDLCSQEA